MSITLGVVRTRHADRDSLFDVTHAVAQRTTRNCYRRCAAVLPSVSARAVAATLRRAGTQRARSRRRRKCPRGRARRSAPTPEVRGLTRRRRSRAARFAGLAKHRTRTDRVVEQTQLDARSTLLVLLESARVSLCVGPVRLLVELRTSARAALGNVARRRRAANLVRSDSPAKRESRVGTRRAPLERSNRNRGLYRFRAASPGTARVLPRRDGPGPRLLH